MTGISPQRAALLRAWEAGWAAHETFVASTPRDESQGCIDRTCRCDDDATTVHNMRDKEMDA